MSKIISELINIEDKMAMSAENVGVHILRQHATMRRALFNRTSRNTRKFKSSLAFIFLLNFEMLQKSEASNSSIRQDHLLILV